MNTLINNIQITNLSFDLEHCTMKAFFSDGKEIQISLLPYRGLKNATLNSLKKYELWDEGKWIHWEELDEDLSAEVIYNS